MPQTPLTFALFGSVYQSADSDFLHQLFSCLHEKGAHVLVEEAYLAFVNKTLGKHNYALTSFKDLDVNAPFCGVYWWRWYAFAHRKQGDGT